jgi:hypothetical protein
MRKLLVVASLATATVASSMIATTDEAQAQRRGFERRNEVRSYAYKNLGNAYNGLKRYDEAATALKKSLLRRAGEPRR